MASFRARVLMRLVSLYPPYLGAGVRVTYPKDDANRIVVRMGLHFWNKNLFGTQFGGALYSMCAPHLVFLSRGRGRVTATFHVPPERIAEIRAAADRGEKVEPVLVAEVVADDGGLVARVTERLWVKKKEV